VQRRRETAEKKAQEAEMSRREAEQSEHARRLDTITTDSDTFCIASLTHELVGEIEKARGVRAQVSPSLSRYLTYVDQAAALRSRLSGSNGQWENGAQAEEGTLTDGLGELEAFHDSLAEACTPSAFFNLLEKAGQHSATLDKAEHLKRLLNIEDIQMVPGQELEPKEMNSLDVEEDSGSGRRIFIQEVLERGYRLRDNKTTIKRPRVTIRLQD